MVLCRRGFASIAGIGTSACLAMGWNFLGYAALADLLGVSGKMARSHGILAVEIGVGITVMAVMVSLYYDLASGGDLEEGVVMPWMICFILLSPNATTDAIILLFIRLYSMIVTTT